MTQRIPTHLQAYLQRQDPDWPQRGQIRDFSGQILVHFGVLKFDTVKRHREHYKDILVPRVCTDRSLVWESQD